MVTCLVVYGLPGNGKTYAARILSKNLNTKLIPFDGVINVISEYVRKKIGGENSPIEFTGDSHPGIFQNSEDFFGFRDSLDKLITDNEKFFKNFYKKFIENKSPLVNYESGFNEGAIDLGRNGDALEAFAEEILNLVLKYIVKKEQFFIIEGYYFNEEKNFREKIKKLCKKVIFLGCFYKQKNKKSPYLYQRKEFTDLAKVEEQLENDLKNGENSYQSLSKEGAKTKDISLYDVENLLISLYNKNSFYRKLFHLMYKILKKKQKDWFKFSKIKIKIFITFLYYIRV